MTFDTASHCAELNREAHSLLDEGFAVIDLPWKSKNPGRDGWQNERLSVDDIDKRFNGSPRNIGILTGEPSGWLVDIDLDVPEARTAAPFFLPPTERKHGRPSARLSHWWLVADGPIKARKYADPERLPGETKSAMLVELRADGMQTVVPPSIHECGEAIAWECRGKPARVSVVQLERRVGFVAAAALTARRWADGVRHEAMLPLAGLMLRGGMNRDEVRRFVEAVARAAGDPEVEDRLRAVDTTADNIRNNKPATGRPKLAELFGDKVVAKLVEWLGLSYERDEQPAQDFDVSAVVKKLSSIEARERRYLWHPYIELGVFNILAGDYGMAKTWALLAIAAAGSRGWHLPSGIDGRIEDGNCEPFSTLYLTAENDPELLRFRLDRLGGDADRVFFWDTGVQPLPELSNLSALDAALEQTAAKLLVLDPIQSVLGAKIDAGQSTKTRPVLDRVIALARKHGCAVMAAMHINKATTQSLRHRIMDSVDIPAAARSVLFVGRHPADPDQRVLAHLKASNAAEGCTLGFTLDGDGGGVEFGWLGAVDVTIADLEAAAQVRSDRTDTKANEAAEFLRQFLADGPQPRDTVIQAAEDAGISKAALSRVARRLCRFTSGGFPRKTVWELRR